MMRYHARAYRSTAIAESGGGAGTETGASRRALLRGIALGALIGAALAAPVAARADAGGVPGAVQQAQSGAAQQAQSEPARAFDIAAQPLADALIAFNEQADLQVAFRTDEVAGLTSRPVAGSYMPEDALRLLLDGTGLGFRRSAERTITVGRSAADDGTMHLGPILVEGASERATGPVDGYIAKRSATGTKTDTPLIEVPQSISVVGAEQIERQNARTVADALRYTPGIIQTQGFNRTNDGFYSRGFQLNTDSIYQDGLRNQANIFDTMTEPYLLERIEVLHGPASVLYGQASPGGLVSMVSKQPTAEPIHEVQVQAGSFEHKQINTDHAGRLNEEGTLTYRLTAVARDAETMIDYIGDDKAVFAPSLTWQPDDATSLTLRANYNETDTMYYYGLPFSGSVSDNPNGRIARERFIGEPGFNEWDRTAYNVGYAFEHEFDNGVSIAQNLQFSTYDNDYADIWFGTFQPDQRTISRGAYTRADESSVLSIDTHVQGEIDTGPVAHTLLGGLDYSQTSFSRIQYNGTAAALDLYNPSYGGSITLGATPGTEASQNQDQLGLYLQDQIAVGDLRVLLGGRQDWVANKSDNHLTGVNTEERPSAFTGRVGVVYLTPFGLAPYASYAESFQPQSGTDAAGQAFDPTTGTQYEAGVKYEPEGIEGSLTLAVYELTRQKVLTTDPNNRGFQIQEGEVRSRGVEVEGKVSPFAGLTLLANYTYTDAEITKSNTNTLGNTPENTPEWMASLWGEYAFQQSDLDGLVLGGGVRGVGPSVNLTDTVEVPTYTVFDAMIGYERNGWEVALNATNLFDKEYFASCTYGCFYGDARTLIGTIGYEW